MPEASATGAATVDSPKKSGGFFSWLKKKKKTEPAAPATEAVPKLEAGPAAPVVSAPPPVEEKKKGGGLFSWFRKRDSAAPGGESDKARTKREVAEAEFVAGCAKLGGPGGSIAGRDGWFFSSSELQRLGNPRSTANAVSVIADYAQQLRSRGIDLIVAPVPPRAIVYPDKVSKSIKVPGGKKPVRLDSTLKAALDQLASRGVRTVDLTALFLKHRNDKAAPITMTGNTWSPRGVELAAEEIGDAVKAGPGGGRLGTVTGITTESAVIAFTGNLAGAGTKPESLTVRNIGRISGDKVKSVSFSTSGGTLLLMGDGNVLAWREANNPAGASGTFASLADQITAELSVIPDVLTFNTDGRNAPRLKILRDRTNGRSTLGGTRAVVWIFSALDLMSSDWRTVPLQLRFKMDSPELMLR